MRNSVPVLLAFVLCTYFAVVNSVLAQGTSAFTYQGQLRDSGTNAGGTYTMVFRLYDAATLGNQIGTAITNTPTLFNGLFTVDLDFGAVAFNGSARWLDIAVSHGATTQTLTPRVRVLPTPYAGYAASAASAVTSATATTATSVASNSIATASLQSNSVTDTKVVSLSGSKITGPVTNSANLTNGSWNTMVGSLTLQGQTLLDIFQLKHKNTLICGISTNGPFFTKNLHVGYQLALGDSSSVIGYLYYTNTYGVVIGNAVSGYAATINGNLNVTGVIYQSSDRELKENFALTSNRDILERVLGLPISTWNFKTDPSARHVGPTAQDFRAAFNLGVDEAHIATVDEGGVALAAIQGLNQKFEKELKAKDAKIGELEGRLANLETLLKSPRK